MVHGRSNVKASHAMVGPCATFLGSFVHYDFASWWRHWRFFKVKDAPELVVRREFGVYARGSYHV
eukprot:scaffold163041_cov28-Attheya_sp.AAC.1